MGSAGNIAGRRSIHTAATIGRHIAIFRSQFTWKKTFSSQSGADFLYSYCLSNYTTSKLVTNMKTGLVPRINTTNCAVTLMSLLSPIVKVWWFFLQFIWFNKFVPNSCIHVVPTNSSREYNVLKTFLFGHISSNTSNQQCCPIWKSVQVVVTFAVISVIT